MSDLIIVRHYEPSPPDELAELLHRVYTHLLGIALPDEHLTPPQDHSTITDRGMDENSTLRSRLE